MKPFARFEGGVISGAFSDRVFDYLVLYQTIRGLNEAKAEIASGITPPAAEEEA